MKKEEIQKLKHGLYIIHWRQGGISLAAVGSDYAGRRWLACTNWTHQKSRSVQTTDLRVWEGVEKVGLICESRY